MRKSMLPALATVLAVVLTGCGAITEVAPETAVTTPSATPTRSASPAPAQTEPTAVDRIIGTVVRFTSDRTSVDVTIGEDNPTVRDFLSRLPLEMTLEEFNGREKIAYFDPELTTEGSTGSDPENGDLIYFAPWGNLGFYYDTDGIGYSDATIHIGTYDATADQLSLLEGGPVTIEVVDE
jgi:hypothetical protein